MQCPLFDDLVIAKPRITEELPKQPSESKKKKKENPNPLTGHRLKDEYQDG